MAFLMLLRRMGRGDLTAHGFRATFKTWASERTSFQNEIVEASLAHTIGGKVEQAYRRGDLFEKRRRLRQQWAVYCTAAPKAGTGRHVQAVAGTGPNRACPLCSESDRKPTQGNPPLWARRRHSALHKIIEQPCQNKPRGRWRRKSETPNSVSVNNDD